MKKFALVSLCVLGVAVGVGDNSAALGTLTGALGVTDSCLS